MPFADERSDDRAGQGSDAVDDAPGNPRRPCEGVRNRPETRVEVVNHAQGERFRRFGQDRHAKLMLSVMEADTLRFKRQINDTLRY